MQDTIGTEAYSIAFFIRFKVDIGSSAFDGVYEHFVHEANDGCFIHFGVVI